MTQSPAPDASADRSGCCDGFRTSRRSLLRGALGVGAGLAGTQMFGDALMQTSHAGVRGGNTLVVLSLRGGIDGLGMVVPHGDPGYYKVRPTTAVAKDQVVCADAMFGLHPKMAPLKPFWASGELAAVHAVGLPVANRSHFSAIEEVEDAAPGSALRSGWINRTIGMGPSASQGGLLDGVQLGQPYATTAMTGEHSVLAASSLDELKIPGISGGNDVRRYSSLGTMWGQDDGVLGRVANDALTISRTLGSTFSNLPASTVEYPSGFNVDPFALPLKSAARLIRADLGTDVIAIDSGAWDYHSNYGNLQWGSMQASVDGFARSVAAFLTDLGPLRSRVTLVTISEFGRRVAENGSGGFDHGWGNMMLLAGAGVKGGRYHGTWPGLDANALAEGDLKVTTDYRNVLGEILAKRFPERSLATVFPGLGYRPLGVMA
ncbi:Uncharacterized conserved protein, DUF1501 family [Nocardioides scoriae]|uniref:Uncharacterized conserved protein, DUF1501 family n=1 Tax=Nocardioides scoriae TaxID=642780 RepID=A0A1H1WZ21_9ACTN|nr:DUF1501 domain-containing protein [Nocardioides scoriae]SDT02378.1 Uncharacterized conserved protein, DUF1501 family [Nocardioides scoriae]